MKTTQKIDSPQTLLRLPTMLAVAGLCFGLQGCIDGHQEAAPEEVNPDPDSCNFLPLEAVSWKGGNTWGEELTVSLDPDTMAYQITIDASLQRTVGTVLDGTLVARPQECTYDSDESGAVFTLAPGGVLLGGATAADGNGFAPLLAFRSTFRTTEEQPRRFNDVSGNGNVLGVHDDGVTTAPWLGSGILRNAGTVQNCIGLAAYSANCTPRERGYVAYVADRDAFDYFSSDPSQASVETGGELAGSVIVGQVSGETVVLQLVRTPSHYGLRLLFPAVGTPDGSFSTLDTDGNARHVTLAGTSLSRGEDSATLVIDSPDPGFTEASGDVSGHFIVHAGIYVFASSAAGSAALELGVANAAGE